MLLKYTWLMYHMTVPLHFQHLPLCCLRQLHQFHYIAHRQNMCHLLLVLKENFALTVLVGAGGNISFLVDTGITIFGRHCMARVEYLTNKFPTTLLYWTFILDSAFLDDRGYLGRTIFGNFRGTICKFCQFWHNYCNSSIFTKFLWMPRSSLKREVYITLKFL